jgi:two-component system, NtrC family, sensor kinase
MGLDPAIIASQMGSHIKTRTCEDTLDLELFRNYFGEFPDPVIVTDMESRVVFLNDSAERLTGCSIAEGKPLAGSDILRMDPEDARRSLVEQCSDKGSLSGVSVLLTNSAGEWAPFSLSAHLVSGKDGVPTGCVAVVRDVLSRSSGMESHIPESIFSSVINNFPMPFFTVDTNLTITYMNHHLERLTGYSSTEVVNRMTCAELFRTPHCHTKDCAIHQAIENRAPIAGLRRSILDREGRKIPVALHASVITDSEGRVVGGFEALRDITSVVEAEQKIGMIAENTQEGILMADENRRIIFANSRMTEIVDQPKDELIGKDVGELLPVQHLTIIDDLIGNVDPGRPQQLRFCSTIQPYKNSQQAYRAFETCIVVSRIGKSLITYMFFHDLTKHIEIERQLHNANSFLNNIIRSSADGIVVVDKEGKVLIFNEGAERILGYKAEEVVGKQIASSRIYSPEVAREIMRRMRSDDYGPPGKVTALRLNLVRKDGEDVPVNFSAAIIKKDDREIGSVGIFSDLREQLRIRRELEEAKIQLMQAEKIASVGRLAAGVAHEINNPLSGILLYADMLVRDLAHNPQWSADLQEIIDQTLRCKQIVTRLLEFSRQSVGQKIPFDVNNIINRSAELLAGQSLFYDVEFMMDLQPDIPQMMGDPGQLQQVFTNFVINAGSAMKGKGKIIVTSRFDPDCQEVSLQFADTGPGIPPEIMDKIFEPFFTTKQPGEGTGLGLSVAYGIIQQHGGSIEVKNSHSGGALFTVTLPLNCPEDAFESTLK